MDTLAEPSPLAESLERSTEPVALVPHTTQSHSEPLIQVGTPLASEVETIHGSSRR